ncbi:hypothetical protein QWY28_10520 [Nocardioides sp. SOB77]|uniref:DUF2207 domain-containing protein n=1 Tax=Nocardioides oceani TaxID=3058369 RepID=A0ABT8FFC1_9ACTN|nr:hypothetical protein [Nocardioides oceani]MDN4173378.1 hypothetical protein [Nocardioides oceani]
MQVWERTVDGRHHRVEAEGSVRRRLRWYVDGEPVAEKRSAEDSVELHDEDRPGLGAVKVRFSALGSPRRASVHADHLGALTGAGGIDLVPEEGSPAAKHEARLLAHPNRYAAWQTGIAAAVVLGPLLLGLLWRLLDPLLPDLPAVPAPDLPSIPWPDLPSIPWPDLPSIPWPDLPDRPAWVDRVVDVLGYVLPLAVAFAVARGEVNRRRRRDEQPRD